MFDCFKKKVHIDFENNRDFIAASSIYPFAEYSGKNRDKQYPGYAYWYDTGKGIYWCYRIGNMTVPFGLVGLDFRATGTVYVERRNVIAAFMDKVHYPSTKKNDITYYYEYVIDEHNNMRDNDLTQKTREIIHTIARDCTAETFPQMLKNELPQNSVFKQLLDEFELRYKDVEINRCTSENPKVQDNNPRSREPFRFMW